MASSEGASTPRDARRRRPVERQVALTTVADPEWAFVRVCMHCQAVVFMQFPDGRRLWVPAESGAARILRQGPPGGPRPRPSHGICRACLYAHYAEMLPALRERYPEARY